MDRGAGLWCAASARGAIHRGFIVSSFELSGRKALVTGGARGIGAGIAESLAGAGAGVVIGDILDDLGRTTAEKIGATGANTSFVHLDVTRDADWESAVSSTVETLGGFDILVNNAGIEISRSSLMPTPTTSARCST